jgi:hypothetical protein
MKARDEDTKTQRLDLKKKKTDGVSVTQIASIVPPFFKPMGSSFSSV